MKVVHVQLSHEGREVVVLEVFGKDFLAEHVDLLNYEAISVNVPGYDVVQVWVFDELVGLD